MRQDEAPTLSPDFMAIFQEAPAPIDLTDPLTIDETVSAIQSLSPDEWSDFGFHRPIRYSAGIDQETLGLYDLAISAWSTMARTVLAMDWSEDDQDTQSKTDDCPSASEDSGPKKRQHA